MYVGLVVIHHVEGVQLQICQGGVKGCSLGSGPNLNLKVRDETLWVPFSSIILSPHVYSLTPLS